MLDETIAGRSIIEGLREKGCLVEPIDAVAPRGSGDEDILDLMATRPDFYLLTRDRDFRYHPSTRERIFNSGAGVFVITSAGNKTGGQIVDLVAAAWKRIERFARKNKRPFVAKVTGEGKVELHPR